MPTELFQVWKYWHMDAVDYDKSTYEYLQTIDKQWQIRLPPQKDASGYMLVLGYRKDNAWYKDEEYTIMLTNDLKAKSSRALVYQFTDADNWKRYNRQMQLMEAVPLMTTHVDGGTQNYHTINDITVVLKEFPPGINAAVRTYQVCIMQGK
jgi:hypothetical protein